MVKSNFVGNELSGQLEGRCFLHRVRAADTLATKELCQNALVYLQVINEQLFFSSNNKCMSCQIMFELVWCKG